MRRALYADGIVGSYEHAGWRSRFVNVPIPGSSAANLIACSSGYGDGFYPSWWGIDEHGAICALATDFFVLVEEIDADGVYGL